ncbi:DgyrCDS4340 [Dimorphilus gyrociliatus]|uniref:DgyrCDS4340 n=1 Tax=Dimorphilus gyrociliatus TaxID=2664684 RepID=A0A7I8VGD4_9ANNE|nr:DgyrCDS4340 [Dimorphilus gyrociliatus]
MSLRFNDQHMQNYAKTDSNVDMEGILYIAEKKWIGKGENKVKRYFKLKGNLLFYFKNENPDSEPLGLFVLENYYIELDNDEASEYYAFVIKFSYGSMLETVKLFTRISKERDEWMNRLLQAGCEYLSLQIEDAESRLEQFNPNMESSLPGSKIYNLRVKCENLPHKFSEFPSTYLTIMALDGCWKFVGRTETVEKSISPVYRKPIAIPEIPFENMLKFTIYSVREEFQEVKVEISFALLSLDEIDKDFREFSMDCSTDFHWEDNKTKLFVAMSKIGENNEGKVEASCDYSNFQISNEVIYANPICETFDFESVTATDFMYESRLTFNLPALYLKRLISKENGCLEYLKRIDKVVSFVLDCIMSSVSCYEQEVTKYEKEKSFFKKSTAKADSNKAFAPVNLHLERLMVRENNHTEFYDIWTTGAFTAYSIGYENGGLLRLIENFKKTSEGQELFKIHKRYLLSKKPINSQISTTNSNDAFTPSVYELLTNTVEQLNRIRRRRDIVFSQALTAAVSAIYSCLVLNPNRKEIIKETGFILYFESFLTCFGEEKSMLEDFIPALEDLERCHIVIEKGQKIHYDIEINDDFGGNLLILNSLGRVGVVIRFYLAGDLWENWKELSDKLIPLTVIFFTLGINEKAKIATNTQLQRDCNEITRKKLDTFYNTYKGIFPEKLYDLLRHLHYCMVSEDESKLIKMFYYGSQITRLLKGLHFVSCKSGKDRTSMRVTLIQAEILKEIHSVSDDFQSILNCLRERGCRRNNTEKNTGVAKYAFNLIQVHFLPDLYQPPRGTYKSLET